jgi:hypothetical protein
VECYHGSWTLRGGFFDVSDVPNGPQLEPGFDEHHWPPALPSALRTREGAQDNVGLAFVVNGISPERRRFLAAGGLGVLVGDGQLVHAGNELIAEAYYELRAFKGVQVTLDAQRVQNPAYNRDRGPATILALRFHVQI